jgi:hypothetical protein
LGIKKGPCGPLSSLDIAFSHLRCSQELSLGLSYVGVEPGHGSWRDRQRLRLLNDFLWVYMNTVDSEFEMQMGSSGPACGADSANGLAFLHRLTLSHMDLAQVRVQGGVTSAVADLNHIAIPALHARENHDTISHGLGRRSGGGCIVNAPVGL